MSGLEILGAIAGATQLADMGVRLLKSFLRLYRDIKAVPEDTRDTLNRIHHLIGIAELISTKPELRSPLITSTIHSMLQDIKCLLEIMGTLTISKQEHLIKQHWQVLSNVVKEPVVRKLLDKLESSKATLLLCIETNSYQILENIDLDVKHIRDGSEKVAKQIPIIHENVQATMAMVQGVPNIELQLQSLNANQERLSKKVIDMCHRMPDVDGLFRHIGSPNAHVTQSMRSTQKRTTKKIDESDRQMFIPVAQNPLFTGRKSIVNKIGDSFGIAPGHQHRTVLIGLGGVGKTQIATAFVYSTWARGKFSKVFWTFAKSRSQIIKSFTDIAKALGICSSATVSRTSLSLESVAETSVPSSREVDALLGWMSQEGNTDWLLVFDNLDDLESFDISEFFPKVPFGHILITSRRQNAYRLGTSIPVDVMDDEDALELLYKCSNIANGRFASDAEALITTLGNLPLAIDQAGAYIARGCLNFDDYLQRFKEHQEDLLSEKPPAAVWTYEHTVYTTWEMSVARLQEQNELSVRILDLAASFDSHDIPIELVLSRAQSIDLKDQCFLTSFFDFASPAGNYDNILGEIPSWFVASHGDVTTAIGMLVSFSLVRRKEASKNLVMHPLVHAWVSDRVPSRCRRIDNARDAICLVNRALFNACNLSQFADVQVLYSYVFKCNMQVDRYGELSNRIDIPRLGGCIIAIDAWVPLSVDQATLKMSDRFYHLITENNHSTDWQIPEAMWQIRSAYRLSSQGYRNESSTICESYFKSACPTDRYEEMFQACMAQMYGPSLFRQLKHHRAEAIFARSPTDCDKTGYMLARKNLVLGAIKIDLNQLEESEKYLQSCAEVLRRRVGPEFFIWSVWHLLMALCRLAQERPKDAESIISPILSTRLAMLERGKVVFSFSDYELVEVHSRSLRQQGRFDEALRSVQDVLFRTKSTHAPPARALGELSAALTVLEHLCAKVEKPLESVERSLVIFEFVSVLQTAHSAFDQASDAYSLEWTRGTWVFKFCSDMIGTLVSKFYALVGTKISMDIAGEDILRFQAQKVGTHTCTVQAVASEKDNSNPSKIDWKQPSTSLLHSQLLKAESQFTEESHCEVKLQHVEQSDNGRSGEEGSHTSIYRTTQTISINEVKCTQVTPATGIAELQTGRSKKLQLVLSMKRSIHRFLPTRSRHPTKPAG